MGVWADAALATPSKLTMTLSCPHPYTEIMILNVDLERTMVSVKIQLCSSSLFPAIVIPARKCPDKGPAISSNLVLLTFSTSCRGYHDFLPKIMSVFCILSSIHLPLALYITIECQKRKRFRSNKNAISFPSMPHSLNAPVHLAIVNDSKRGYDIFPLTL